MYLQSAAKARSEQLDVPRRTIGFQFITRIKSQGCGQSLFLRRALICAAVIGWRDCWALDKLSREHPVSLVNEVQRHTIATLRSTVGQLCNLGHAKRIRP